jgi:hypothetical protein
MYDLISVTATQIENKHAIPEIIMPKTEANPIMKLTE